VSNEKQAFNRDGFLLKKNFLSKTNVKTILKSAKSVFKPHLSPELTFKDGMVRLFNEDLNAFINCGKICQHTVDLHKLCVSDKMMSQIKKLGIESPVICTRPVLFFNSRSLAKSEVYYKTPPHQDWRSMQGSLNAIVVWVPLVDINIDLGALEVIPGSHKWGLVAGDLENGFGTCKDVSDDQFTSIKVEAGDVLFFSAFLVHRSGNNVTERIRWSCHFRYNDLNEATFKDRKYPCPYKYGPQPELITPNFPNKELLLEQFK
jgi:hypothetical protein